MKKLIFILPALIISLSTLAQNKGIGAGIMVGEPTGLNARFWTHSNLFPATEFDLNGAIGARYYF